MVYHTVPSLSDDDQDDIRNTSQPKTLARVENTSDAASDHPVARSWVGTVLMQAFALLWLIPIAVLLWLNFSNHVIGQSAWCPHDSCDNATFYADSTIAAATMDQYTKQDHNLLGFLQLVAKALEMWFALVGVWFAYLLMIRMASNKQGLPLEYLSRPSRMGQTWSNFNPRAWAPLLSRGTPGRRRLWIFFVVTLIISVLSALMGPATAVLVLPTQIWAVTTPYYFGRFQHWNAATAPTFKTLSHQKTTCSAEDVTNKNWSCAYTGYGRFFDYWALYSFSNGSYGNFWSYWFIEQSLSFTVNYTSANNQNAAQIPNWVPNRGVVDWLNDDSNNYNAMQYEPPLLNGSNIQDTMAAGKFAQYQAQRKALRLEAERDGPILGFISNSWPSYGYGAENVSGDQGALFARVIDSKRGVRCYPYWAYQSQAESVDPQPGNNYTRCIQTGDWGTPHTSNQTFNITYSPPPKNNLTPSINMTASGKDVTITVFSSERTALLLNGALPSGFSSDCLFYDNQAGCDWDTFFAPNNSSPLANLTQYSMTVDILFPTTPVNAGGYRALDFVTFTNITRYSMDPSPVTNPNSIVQTQNLPPLGSALPVDPNWYLLTLSVDAGGQIPPVRTVPLLTLSNPTPENSTDGAPWDQIVPLIFSTFQYMLTIIDFDVDMNSSALNTNTTADAAGQPALAFQTRYYTWGYSNSSSSFKFGAAVAIMGVVVIVAYLVLSSLDRRENRSITDIIASALEHGTSGVFGASQSDGKEKGKVRFRMVESEAPRGRFIFEPAVSQTYEYVARTECVAQSTVDLERSRSPSPIFRPEAPQIQGVPLRSSRFYST